MSDTVVVMDTGEIRALERQKRRWDNEPDNAFVGRLYRRITHFDAHNGFHSDVVIFRGHFQCLDKGFEKNEAVERSV